jgi:hypothetical protein
MVQELTGTRTTPRVGPGHATVALLLQPALPLFLVLEDLQVLHVAVGTRPVQ